MKKMFALVASTFLLTSTAFAAGSGTLTSSGSISSADCDRLISNINVGLSANVVAAYDCETHISAMYAGAASLVGSKKSRDLKCVVTKAKDADGPGQPAADQYNNTQCTEPDETVTVTGTALYYGNSAGGQVAQGTVGDTGGAGTNCVTGAGADAACAGAILSTLAKIAKP